MRRGKKSEQYEKVTTSMIEKLGRDLFGNQEHGPGAWRGQYADLLGMHQRQLARILVGESDISKPRAKQYWAVRSLMSRLTASEAAE